MWIQQKYINQISSALDRFKQTSLNPPVFNFRCPYCGDGKRNRSRGYLYSSKDSFAFYCHNCNASRSFGEFLKHISSQIYSEYILEKLKNKPNRFKKTTQSEKTPIAKTNISNVLKFGPTLDTCSNDDVVLQYAKSRKLPEKMFGVLHSCKSLKNVTSKIERYAKLEITGPALIIPFYDVEGNYSYISCRLLSSKLRYLTLEIDRKRPKIWGLDRVNWNEQVFIFEGVLDAISIPNSLAMAGAYLSNNTLKFFDRFVEDRSQITFVYDNELITNKDIKKAVTRRIKNGFKVVLFDRFFNYKDVNEALCKGEKLYGIIKYLKQNSFYDLEARLRLSYLTKANKAKQ